MSQIAENLKKYIKSKFYTELINEKQIKLTEESVNDKYEFSVNFAKKENHYIIIRDLKDLKENYASYLVHHPEDCDYIFLDLIKKRIVFIDLKCRGRFNKSDARSQLEAGEHWLRHLLFCSDNPNLIEDPSWKKYWIVLNHRKSRPSVKTQYKDYIECEHKRFMPIFEGQRFTFESLLIGKK